jgi:asparagine synthase (glutamine-hydrolysing)
MIRRGPDGSGEWFSADRHVGLAHRRLAIIDLSERAAQPMASADGNLVVTFNGEIYNYASLKEGLQQRGYAFRTTSDTEVLLYLYAEYGVNMLGLMRGMFALAIYDLRKKGVLLARDPYGIKPLYYADDGQVVRFGSQVRALLAGGGISKTVDPAGQVGFYLWGSVPEPFTSHQAVRCLPAGTHLWVDAAGKREPQQYFSQSRVWFDAARSSLDASPGAQEREIHEALRDSVVHHMVADVPVSAFLSGGIDSGALVGLMSEQRGTGLAGITLCFTEFEGRPDDEVPLASEVARKYGVKHYVRRVTQAEFESDLPRIFEAMDQPTIDGVNTWFVSKATAELGFKVAISGLGGDELFGGYNTFRDVPRLVCAGRLPGRIPGLGEAVRKVATSVLSHVPNVHPKFAGLAEYGGSYPGAYLLKRGLFMPWELTNVLAADIVEAGLEKLSVLSALKALLIPEPEAAFAKVATLEASQYMRNQLLRDTDWASMAHSLEVRIPLVDSMLLQRVAPYVLSLARASGKAVLANAPRSPLPHSVQGRRKTGFSTPVEDWLKSSPNLSTWNRVSGLRSERCPWARRFAFAVAEHLGFNGS